MSYIVNSSTRTRTRNEYGKFMATPDELDQQAQYLSERERYAATIEAMRFESVLQSFNGARLEKIEIVAERQAYMNWWAKKLELAHNAPMTDTRETAEAYRLAAIALSKQVVKHLPR